MMNDVVSDDEEDSETLRRQRKSIFGFQVLSAKLMRESMTTAEGETEMGSLLPSCQGGRASILPGLSKKRKRKKLGTCLG